MNASLRLPSRSFGRLTLLFLGSLVLQLAGTWILPLVDRDETYYAEVSREMIASGDYLVPHFNNEPWLEKPPLLYWCQCGAFQLFGQNEFAARFPSAVATALTALVIFGFCSSIYDAPCAWRAAISYVLCLQLLIYGRAGIPDMLVVLFTTLATWAGWELLNGKAERKWWWAFYLSLAAIALAKGPLAIIPVCSVAIYAVWQRQRDFFRIMKWGRGLTLAVVLTGLWAVPVLIATKGEFYRVFIGEHVLSRSVSPMQGHGSSTLLGYLAMVPFYVVLLFPAFLPWSWYLIPALRRFWLERTRAELYLASGILVTFLLFSIASTKLPHYTLPAFPLIACALAPSIPPRRFKPLAAVMAGLNLLIAFILFPVIAKSSAPLQLAASPMVETGMKFATVDFAEPSLIWQLRSRITSWEEIIKPKRIASYMSKPGGRLCVLPTQLLGEIPLDPEWKVISVRGINLAKGKPLELSMLIKRNQADQTISEANSARQTLKSPLATRTSPP